MNSTQTAHAALTADLLKPIFEHALPYSRYVATGNEGQRDAWQKIFDQAHLTPEQEELLSGFRREMKVLVSSGIWCGDCVQQCPLMQRIVEGARGMIHLRFVDRDDHDDLKALLRINGGERVPVAVFMAEDYEPVSVFGDRTLSRYRAIAARQLGAACPMPGAPVDDDELAATLQDWLNEFERVHLLLRLSTRLREKHGD